MLRYVGLGYRRFGIQPTKSPPRVNWEIFAVVSGQCAPVLPKEESPLLKANTLWVFPPGQLPWLDRKRTASRVHHGLPFRRGSPAIGGSRTRARLPRAPRSTQRSAGGWSQWPNRCGRSFSSRPNFSNLMYQSALIELALLVLRKLPILQKPLPPSPAKRTVEAATAWYGSNLASTPSVAQVASERCTSPPAPCAGCSGKRDARVRRGCLPGCGWRRR
jgi:hypothetical protein